MAKIRINTIREVNPDAGMELPKRPVQKPKNSNDKTKTKK